MEALFLKLLSMSIPASILIGVVVLLRVLLRKSPKWVHCILWGLVAIRLVCPFSIESKFSLVPNAETVNTRLTGEQVLIQPDVTYNGQPESDDVTGPKQQEQPEADKKEKTKQWDALSVISWVWLAGCMTLSAYALFGYFRIKKSVKLSVRTQENIYICDRIRSPFILGVIRPRIYLPSNMSEVQKENVIAHEKAHIKRLDYLWKPFGFFLLSVYWFNPLCWLAYILLCRDIELACDEKVIRDMDVNQKKIYSEVLLSFSTSEKVITACPLAFGEVGARQRIKAVLSYKKPGFWIIVAAVVLIVVTSVLFLTSRTSNKHYPQYFLPIIEELESSREKYRQTVAAPIDVWWDMGSSGGGKCVDKIFSCYINGEYYSFDSGNLLSDTNEWDWDAIGIFPDEKTNKTFVIFHHFDIVSETKEAPSLILLEFDTENPEDYTMTPFDVPVLNWADVCYRIGDNIYIAAADNNFASINLNTKELSYFEEEYRFSDSLINEYYEETPYHMCGFWATLDQKDIIIYSAYASEAFDTTPVGMISVAYEDSQPIAYMVIDLTKERLRDGVKITRLE